MGENTKMCSKLLNQHIHLVSPRKKGSFWGCFQLDGGLQYGLPNGGRQATLNEAIRGRDESHRCYATLPITPFDAHLRWPAVHPDNHNL